MTKAFEEDLAAGIGTRAIHAGQRPEPLAGAIMTPVYLTSTYVQEGLGRHKGYEYARSRNPTREALERNVAALEGARHGFAFASGTACVDSLMKLFKAGDHVVCGENVYGGTFRLFDRLLKNFGLEFTYVDSRDPNRIAEACRKRTVAVLVETPTNPLMRLTDLRAAADIAHRADALLIVDNTFATPVLQRPFSHGADIVFHSTTKYLNGHSDMIGGIAVLNDDALATRLEFVQNAGGAVPGPFDCFLVHRGLRTLALRVARHTENGRAVSEWLRDAPGVEDVRWPGFGGMVSFRHPDAVGIVGRTELFSLAESLGGVESLIEVPQAMTHQSVEDSDAAVPADLVRLSCGIEAAEDLIADLERALA